MKKILRNIKAKLFTKVEKQHSEEYLRRIAFFNKYSTHCCLVASYLWWRFFREEISYPPVRS